MSKPSPVQPSLPDAAADDSDNDVLVTPDVERIIRERLETFVAEKRNSHVADVGLIRIYSGLWLENSEVVVHNSHQCSYLGRSPISY